MADHIRNCKACINGEACSEMDSIIEDYPADIMLDNYVSSIHVYGANRDAESRRLRHNYICRQSKRKKSCQNQ